MPDPASPQTGNRPWEGPDPFQFLLEQLPVGVLLQSPSAEILSSNPRAMELLGLSEDQLLGRTSFHPDWNIIHEDGAAFPGPTHPVPRAIATRQAVRDVVMGVYRPTSQDRVWLLVNALPELAPDGSVRMVLCTFTDITEQVRREEERRRMEAQLQQVQKMESLGLLAGGVAHDINNVLGSILAVATLHRRKAAEGTPLRRDMDTITQACIRGGSLTKSLQGFARKELGEERLLDLNDLIQAEVRHLERTVDGKIRISEELSADLRGLKGDPAALKHTIMSLCANAIESMPQGGSLTIRTRNQGPETIVVEVEDSGTGMPPEVVGQAMAPFFTTKQSTKVTGLGLSLVYGTVRAHRGTIELTSEPGRGTLVRLRFPTPGIGKADAADSGPSDIGAAPGKAILFVDDDPLILQSMPGLLECLGHSTTTAASGEEALALLEQGCQPDLVILDVNMPGLGGLETLVRLRSLVSTLPVLLSTGFASEALRELVKAHPEVHLIAKPFTLAELDHLIRVAAP